MKIKESSPFRDMGVEPIPSEGQEYTWAGRRTHTHTIHTNSNTQALRFSNQPNVGDCDRTEGQDLIVVR